MTKTIRPAAFQEVDGHSDGSTSGPGFGRRVAVLCSAALLLLGLFLSHPAAAEPGGPSVPNGGARPPSGGTQAGNAAGQNQYVPPVLGPFAQQVRAETIAVQELAEQLKQVEEQHNQARTNVEAKRRDLDRADVELQRLREQADNAAAEAYKASRELGPLSEYADELHKLSKMTPVLGQRAGGEATARELARAEEAHAAADNAYRTANDAATVLSSRYSTMRTSYDQKSAALATLRTRNAQEYARAEAEQDAYERSIGYSLNLGAGPDGWEPHPNVRRVLEYALSKRGKPYVFGDEGPNTYDCSGLVWDSYRQVGVHLPRIANQQYNATTKIARKDLLPGDLVFFGPPGPWTGIGHVGIYLGGQQMVQAPSSGDVVKISTVTWSRFYGATRILPARKITPTPTPGPSSSSSSPAATVSPWPPVSSSSSSSAPVVPSSSTSKSSTPSTSPSPSTSAGPSSSVGGSPATTASAG